jgi:hypothetical protein
MNNVINRYGDYCSSFTFKYGNLEIKNSKEYQGCHINTKEKLIYLHIDKCASTSITSALKSAMFIDMSTIDVNDIKMLVEYKKYKSFCVIRDPVKRWISGLGEFMNRFDVPSDYVIEQVKNRKYIFDYHTAPQHLSIDPYIDKLDNTYLKLDANLEDKINQLLCHSEIYLSKERESNLITKLTCEKIFHKYVRINLKYFYKLYEKDFVLYGKSI